MNGKLPAILFSIAFCMLFPISVHADSEYIIKIANTQLFSEVHNIGQKLSHNIVVVDDLSDVQDYIDAGIVEYYEPNYEVELFAVPNDEQYSKQKYHTSIGSQTAWDIETYGNNVNIAVIDSGCFKHTDICGNLSTGYNYLDNNSDISDTIGHGTHISGIIAAEMNDIGVVGIANRANIIPLKCFDTGTTTKVATIIDAIYDAVDKYDCDIINMSWGIANNSKTLSEAVSYATQKGVIMIAAVGNGGGSDLAYPAAYDSVIGVGSVDDKMNHSSSSRHNTSVFVVAPGENIYSIDNDGGYSSDSGTSYAAPMVTALSAIALNIDSNITIEVLKKRLEMSSIDLGNVGYDEYYGYGMINIGNIINDMLADKRIYIAPIEQEGNVVKIALYNSGKDLCEGILATTFYANNSFMQCSLSNVSILPHETNIYSVPFSNTNETIRCFCWESLNTMLPLSNVRIR